MRAGNPLDQHSHLFVLVFQASLFPVLQSRYIHNTGVNSPHCILKDLQPLFQCSLIYTEHRLIFSRKGVAESVFQETGRTDDNGTLSEIFQHRAEFFPDIGRKLSGEQGLLKLSGFLKIAFFCPLGDPGLPAVIGNNIGIKYVRTNVIGIVGLPVCPVFRQKGIHDLPGQEHTASLSSNSAAANHPVPEFEIIFGFKIFLQHFLKPLILSHGAFQDLIFRLFPEPSLLILQLRHGKEPVMAVKVLVLLLGLFLFQDLIVPA